MNFKICYEEINGVIINVITLTKILRCVFISLRGHFKIVDEYTYSKIKKEFRAKVSEDGTLTYNLKALSTKYDSNTYEIKDNTIFMTSKTITRVKKQKYKGTCPYNKSVKYIIKSIYKIKRCRDDKEYYNKLKTLNNEITTELLNLESKFDEEDLEIEKTIEDACNKTDIDVIMIPPNIINESNMSEQHILPKKIRAHAEYVVKNTFRDEAGIKVLSVDPIEHKENLVKMVKDKYNKVLPKIPDDMKEYGLKGTIGETHFNKIKKETIVFDNKSGFEDEIKYSNEGHEIPSNASIFLPVKDEIKYDDLDDTKKIHCSEIVAYTNRKQTKLKNQNGEHVTIMKMCETKIYAYSDLVSSIQSVQIFPVILHVQSANILKQDRPVEEVVGLNISIMNQASKVEIIENIIRQNFNTKYITISNSYFKAGATAVSEAYEFITDGMFLVGFSAMEQEEIVQEMLNRSGIYSLSGDIDPRDENTGMSKLGLNRLEQIIERDGTDVQAQILSNRDRGSCKSGRKHKKIIFSGIKRGNEIINIEVISIGSTKDNNCGIAVSLRGSFKTGTSARHSYIRKKVIGKAGMLDFFQMDKINNHLEQNLQIHDNQGQILHGYNHFLSPVYEAMRKHSTVESVNNIICEYASIQRSDNFNYDNNNFRTVRALLDDNHYYNIEKIVSQEGSCACNSCGCAYNPRLDHVCKAKEKYNGITLLHDDNTNTESIMKHFEKYQVIICDFAAGYGKTWKIINDMSRDGNIFTSMTGKTAIPIGGNTLHFALGIKVYETEKDHIVRNKGVNKFHGVKCFVLDEGMRISPDLLKKLIFNLNEIKNTKLLILGDSTQSALDNYGSEILGLLSRYKTLLIDSDKTLRCKGKLKRIVQRARNREMNPKDITQFTLIPEDKFDVNTVSHVLCPYVKQVKKYNTIFLRQFPGEKLLKYKKGLPVLMYENDKLKGITNGDDGILENVTQTPKSYIFHVRYPDDSIRMVYAKKISFKDVIKPYFAITIQKSQGMTITGKYHILLTDIEKRRSEFYTGISRGERVENIMLLGDYPKGKKWFNNTYDKWSNIVRQNKVQVVKYEEYMKKDGALLGGYEKIKKKIAIGKHTSVIVDLETYNRSATRIIKAYSNHSKVSKLIFVNKETGVIYNSKHVIANRLIRKCIRKQGKPYNIESYQPIKFLKMLLKLYEDGDVTLKHPCHVKSYNGSGFDYHLLFRAINNSDVFSYENGWVIKWIQNNNIIKVLTIEREVRIKGEVMLKKAFIFGDVFLFVPFTSLKNACNDFGANMKEFSMKRSKALKREMSKNNGKLEFPFELVNTIEKRDMIINACLLDTPWLADETSYIESKDIIITDHDRNRISKDRMIYLDQYLKDNPRINIVEANKKYVERDTDLTSNLYNQVNKILVQDTITQIIKEARKRKIVIPKADIINLKKLGIEDFMTITSLSKYFERLWVSWFKKLCVYPNHLKLGRLNKKHYEWIKASIYGGRSLPRQTYRECKKCYKILKEGTLLMKNWNLNNKESKTDMPDFFDGLGCNQCTIALDFKAMYGSIQSHFYSVLGVGFDLEEKQLELLQQSFDRLHQMWKHDNTSVYGLTGGILNLMKFSIDLFDLPSDIAHFNIYCHVTPNDKDVEPGIPYHGECGKLSWKNEPRTQQLTAIDIYNTLADGGKIDNIKYGMYWKETFGYKAVLNKLYTSRKDKAQKEGNIGVATANKLLSNAGYGASLSKNYNDIIYRITSQADVNKIKLDQHFIWKETFIDNSGVTFLRGTRKEYQNDFLSDQNIENGVIILAASRLMYNKATTAFLPHKLSGDCPIPESIILGDTDSMVVPMYLVMTAANRIIKKATGFLTDELGEKYGWSNRKYLQTRIIRSINPAPKVYAIEYIQKFKQEVYSECICMSSLETEDKETHPDEPCKCSHKMHLKLTKKGFIRLDKFKYFGTKVVCKGINKKLLAAYAEIENITVFDLFVKMAIEGFQPKFEMYNKIKRVAHRLNKQQFKDEMIMYSLILTNKTRSLNKTVFKGRNFSKERYEDDNVVIIGYSVPWGHKNTQKIKIRPEKKKIKPQMECPLKSPKNGVSKEPKKLRREIFDDENNIIEEKVHLDQNAFFDMDLDFM